jgi:hypothetical protein
MWLAIRLLSKLHVQGVLRQWGKGMQKREGNSVSVPLK